MQHSRQEEERPSESQLGVAGGSAWQVDKRNTRASGGLSLRRGRGPISKSLKAHPGLPRAQAVTTPPADAARSKSSGPLQTSHPPSALKPSGRAESRSEGPRPA
eukprot:5778157-Alexandrium_andersonii.AAC.1